MARIYDNGVYRDMTQEEIDELNNQEDTNGDISIEEFMEIITKGE